MEANMKQLAEKARQEVRAEMVRRARAEIARATKGADRD